jgi:hypothetical protein
MDENEENNKIKGSIPNHVFPIQATNVESSLVAKFESGEDR